MTVTDSLTDGLAFSHVQTKRIHLEAGADPLSGDLELTFALDSGIVTEDNKVGFSLILRTDSPQLVLDVEIHAMFESSVKVDPELPEAWVLFRTMALPALRESLLRIQDSVLPMLLRGVEIVPPAEVLREAISMREDVARHKQYRADGARKEQ